MKCPTGPMSQAAEDLLNRPDLHTRSRWRRGDEMLLLHRDGQTYVLHRSGTAVELGHAEARKWLRSRNQDEERVRRRMAQLEQRKLELEERCPRDEGIRQQLKSVCRMLDESLEESKELT